MLNRSIVVMVMVMVMVGCNQKPAQTAANVASGAQKACEVLDENQELLAEAAKLSNKPLDEYVQQACLSVDLVAPLVRAARKQIELARSVKP